FSRIREGDTHFTVEHLVAAVEGRLRRLQTDRIDLYQLHWPDRNVPMFGGTAYVHDPDEVATPPEETLRALEDLVQSGKVLHVGLSNETPWGTMRFLLASEHLGLPRVQTVQNAYSLLNRTFEDGLAEIALREDCGLLAYSPLAMGLLSGKYEGGRTYPEGARLTLFRRFGRYSGARGLAASERYVQIARDAGLDPAQMALAWVNQRPFLTSNLIGATTLDQLRTDLGSAQVTLSDDVLAALEAVHAEVPNPCP
ncbi:MAG: aldo/keto reductase, partial [Myxococcales bacterium]|nr:aldo/keto reductase [Myxococcales bacterium]